MGPVSVDSIVTSRWIRTAVFAKDWKGKQVQLHPVSTGITNKNYRVEVDGKWYFLRIPGKATDLLSVNRAHEHYNTVAASNAAVSPKVLYYLEPESIMVLEYVTGEIMSIRSLQTIEAINKIVHSLKMLHSGPRFANEFNMFRLREFYLDVARKHDVRIPDDYYDYSWVADRIEKAMVAQPTHLVPCHNDLLAENFIDDGKFMWIIDYEYSGNNDCCFELGNVCIEMEYTRTQVELLCKEYFGAVLRNKIARMSLYSIMSDVGWTLWGSIQNKVSDLDFDFWSYTMNRWNRAKKNIDSSEFSGWLNGVTEET